MTEGLTITKTEGKVLVMHLSGMLDGQTHETLYSAARGRVRRRSRQLVLDLKQLEVITSAGLGSLHNIYKLFTPKAEIEAWEKGQPRRALQVLVFQARRRRPPISTTYSISPASSATFPCFPICRERSPLFRLD